MLSDESIVMSSYNIDELYLPHPMKCGVSGSENSDQQQIAIRAFGSSNNQDLSKSPQIVGSKSPFNSSGERPLDGLK